MRFFKYTLIILLTILSFIYIYRVISPREIDDLSPSIECDYSLIEKSDVLWVIPIFENKSIAQDKEWCEYVLSLNKTLGMHGVYHSYREMGEIRNKEYLERGIYEFEKCFGYKPVIFKAPQMNMNWDNLEVIKESGLENKGMISQILHKVYHCSDSGEYSNKFIDYF